MKLKKYNVKFNFMINAELIKIKPYFVKKIHSMKSFFLKMLSSSNEVSSKRFIGLCAFVMLIIIGLKILFSDSPQVNEGVLKEILYALLFIISATFLGGTVENIMIKPTNISEKNTDTKSPNI
jgi:hypothetical protein